MAHTNSTTNYSLPQFITTDKPAWLTDINGAFSDLDTAVYAAQTKADTAYNDAGTAQSDATAALTNASAADAKGSGALASIESAFDPTTIYSVGAKVIYNSLLYRCTVAVVTPGPWTGSDNWERITVDNLISTTDSKIGQLTSLSTTDKTSIVNAVNEVNGKVGNTSALTTTDKSNIVAAVNEVNNGLAGIRMQMLTGNGYYVPSFDSTAENKPYSVLIVGYDSTALVRGLNKSSWFSDSVHLNGSGLTVSSGRLRTGTDNNRQFFAILPKGVTLTWNSPS